MALWAGTRRTAPRKPPELAYPCYILCDILRWRRNTLVGVNYGGYSRPNHGLDTDVSRNCRLCCWICHVGKRGTQLGSVSQINADSLQTWAILIMMLAVAVVGLGILIWMSPVQASNITPAQDRLMNIADWMVKAAIGAILGYSGARLAARSGSQAA